MKRNFASVAFSPLLVVHGVPGNIISLEMPLEHVDDGIPTTFLISIIPKDPFVCPKKGMCPRILWPGDNNGTGSVDMNTILNTVRGLDSQGIPSRSLTVRPWKMMVGRLILSFWDGRAVKLPGGINSPKLPYILHHPPGPSTAARNLPIRPLPRGRSWTLLRHVWRACCAFQQGEVSGGCFGWTNGKKWPVYRSC